MPDSSENSSSTDKPTLNYQARRVRFPNVFSQTNEKATLSLAGTVIAFCLELWWLHVSNGSTGPTPDRLYSLSAILIFVAVPLSFLALIFAIAGIIDRDGQAWPAWATILIFLIGLIIFRMPG